MTTSQGRHGWRQIRFLRVIEVALWRLKLYEILYGVDAVDPRLVEAAEVLAARTLERWPGSEDDARLGYACIHQGNGANVIFFGLWTNENEMRHVSFWGTGWSADALTLAETGDPVVCVWDLELMHREREAWVTHMLDDPYGPDGAAYLGATFSTMA